MPTLAVQKGEAGARLAIAERDAPTIHIYDVRSGSEWPVSSVTVRGQLCAFKRTSDVS